MARIDTSCRYVRNEISGAGELLLRLLSRANLRDAGGGQDDLRAGSANEADEYVATGHDAPRVHVREPMMSHAGIVRLADERFNACSKVIERYDTLSA
jgi:hypothetical protein